MLSGELSEFRPVVPASIVITALLSEDARFAETSKTPLVSTILPTEIEPTPVTGVGVVGGMTAKLAVTETLAVMLVSVRSAVVTPSLQLTNSYQSAGTAVTVVPESL